MSCNCCTGSGNNKLACPACQQLGDAVSTATLLHQLARPWQQAIGEQQYYFCRQPECEIAYFDNDGICFNTNALRQPERLLCYCFDIRFQDIADAESEQRCREFVTAKTRSKLCSCETHNPSGKCCLRDFPKQKE